MPSILRPMPSCPSFYGQCLSGMSRHTVITHWHRVSVCVKGGLCEQGRRTGTLSDNDDNIIWAAWLANATTGHWKYGLYDFPVISNLHQRGMKPKTSKTLCCRLL